MNETLESNTSNNRRSCGTNCRKSVKKHFCEYCENTSIHGFRYLGEQHRTYAEKFWWLITISCSLITCLYLISLTYRKWMRSPVIVSFATEQTPIWQIPFPSVTICPEIKVRQSVYNFTKNFRNMKKRKQLSMSEREQLKFEYASLVCSSSNDAAFQHETFGDDALDFLYNISVPVDDMFLACLWLGEQYSCEGLFVPLWTDDGLCYTFNMLDRDVLYKNETTSFYKDFLATDETSQWSITDGYNTKDKDTYPRRALFSGAKSGLEILVKAKHKDIDYLCSDAATGYKVSLTNPSEVPRVSEQYFRLPLNQSIIAAVKPVMMTTSDTLKTYDPKMRKCYFSHERNLHYFNIYTQQSCEVECIMNYTYHKCGCIEFHMPYSDNASICAPLKESCSEHAKQLALSSSLDLEDEMLEFAEYLHLLAGNGTTYGEAPSSCDCLPNCVSIEYDVETSQSDFPWTKLIEGYELNDLITEQTYMSHLVLFFKNSQFLTSERNELYGTTDFLANCGGLLGLFTGFSVISFVEILYHLSFRWICTRRLNKMKYRSKP